MPRPPSYLICATPRSGSTLLCDALANTGLAGRPDEYFGPMHVERWDRAWRTRDEAEYLQHALRAGTGANGVFGCKVMRVYWDHFIGHLRRATGLEQAVPARLVQAAFPGARYIWITRRDKIRQAVSWSKFVQGAAWYWEKEEPQVVDNLEFRPDIIDDFIMQTALGEAAWQDFFASVGAVPHVVVYEDFIRHYQETVRSTLGFLGVDPPKALEESNRRLKKQADGLTEEWVSRYRSLKTDQAG